MIIKCKMCGGDMKLSPDKRTGTCEYCGSTMTLPKVDDEQRAAAFNRGNYFRRIGEFDKALSVYESIVREDDTDAEAHWCCALCRFGIEYVKDPVSGEYIPTCHRVSFDSFLEDVDYKAALEHADAVARAQYEKDAEKIAQVQKGILSISQKEKPFDVFICYKETDENGNRTVDSTLAQDIYYQLTEQGRRVFFARITLEDKAGQEYEPYIFAALHSAKVMLVVGTKPEYFNAVWVKNEWSRYLAIMKHDRKRLLIPCYRDMDPYALPEQLSVLQSYDMSKIGFIQDLIRGIAKVLDADKKPKEKVIERVIEHNAGGVAPGTESLMKRVCIFMEDGDFDSADEYLNRVLDIVPNYAPAYAAKTCVDLKLRRINELSQATYVYSSNSNWEKALRFATDEEKQTYEDYIKQVGKRVERQIRDYAYDCAMEIAARPNAPKLEDIKKEEKLYKNSCYETDFAKRANGSRREGYAENEKIFQNAVEQNNPGYVTEAAYKGAAAMFQAIGDEEAKQRAEQCFVLAELARKRLELEERIRKQKAKERKDKSIKMTVLATTVIILLAGGILVNNKIIQPRIQYKNAVNLLEAGKYNEAIDAFTALGDYSDAPDKILETKYQKAVKLMEQGQYVEAYAKFNKIRSYKGVDELLSSHKELQDAYFAVGREISFGTYEQDGDTENGAEDIEWIVLAKDGDKALLLSKYGLDAKPYNEEDVDVTWENSSIRNWLNSSFMNIAFNETEQAAILETVVDNSKAEGDSSFDTNGGNDTKDRLFLLSYQEAFVDYFTSYSARICKPTAYAEKQGASIYDARTCVWWLRSPGNYQSSAAVVINNGSPNDIAVSLGYFCVRPALWVNLSSDSF